MRSSERAYRLLLRLYPRGFRARFGDDMTELVRDRLRDARGRGARLGAWSRVVRDVVVHAAAERRAGRLATIPPARRGYVMHGLLEDLRFAWRSYSREPGFTAVVIVTLALGVAANTTIFSAVNGILLRPFPFTDPARVVSLYETYGDRFDHGVIAPGNFAEWRAGQDVFSGMAAIRRDSMTLTGGGEPESLPIAAVSPSYFDVLGVRPILGRAFAIGEDRPGRSDVVVLGHGVWRRRFGGDPGLVGRTIRLDGRPHTVIGVAPRGFEFPLRVQLWTPLVLEGELATSRQTFFLGGIARLKPGIGVVEARSALAAIAARLEQAYPGTNRNRGANVVSLHEDQVRSVAGDLAVLQGAALFVLLVACANVANLLLARGVARRRELGLRAAVGAGRRRLVRQLLTESLLLAGAGGLAGLFVSVAGVRMLVLAAPAWMPRVDRVGVDGWVLAFTLAVSIATSLLFGLAPAVRATRLDLVEALKHGAWSGEGGFRWSRRNRFRVALVVGEIALAVVLLAGAGLLVRSFTRLTSEPTGLDPHRLLTVQLRLPSHKYAEPAMQRAFVEALVDRARALPSVTSAAVTLTLPFSFGQYSQGFRLEGQEWRRGPDGLSAGYRPVTPSYFATVGMRVTAGRGLTASDTPRSEPVAVVNEAFVREFLDGGGAVGRQLQVRDEDAWRTVVGVVTDVRHRSYSSAPESEIYLPFAQSPETFMMVVAKTTGDPGALAGPVRDVIRAIDPDQPIADMATMDERMALTVALPRLYMQLLGAFAAVAFLLAAVGVYGVMAYATRRRARELGIRVALGASGSQVRRLVMGQGAALAALGVGVGLAGAAALTRLLASQLYRIAPTDPLTYGLVASLVSLVALAACWAPARRAAGVDPIVTLRAE